MEDLPDGYFISTEPTRLQVAFIMRALQATYWAKDRSESVMIAAIQGSLCFGVYSKSNDMQVGFARVVTDRATFSWLCDVFVDPAHRNRGLGKALVAAVLQHPALTGTRFHLGTKDAHGLYEKFGFARTETMRRPGPSAAAHGDAVAHQGEPRRS